MQDTDAGREIARRNAFGNEHDAARPGAESTRHLGSSFTGGENEVGGSPRGKLGRGQRALDRGFRIGRRETGAPRGERIGAQRGGCALDAGAQEPSSSFSPGA
jgi:hypothetical protein